MRIRHFRHPVLALMGAVLFLFLGVSDALGSNRCAHHATTYSAVDEVAPTVVESAPEDHTHHHHGAPAAENSGDPVSSHDPGEGTDAHEESPHNTCDCGLFCVGMAGPPPVQPGAALVSYYGLTPTTALLLPASDEDLEPICRIPYLLPFSNGPPSLFL